MRKGSRAGVCAVLLGGVVWSVGLAGAETVLVGGADAARGGGSWAGASRADAPRAVGLRGAAGALALEAIDSCVRKLNPDIDIGYDRVIARCPALARRLDESGWAVWLPNDWRRPGNDLSVAGLRELRDVVSRGLTGGGGRVPSTARVTDILASLARSEDERGGWWARAKALIGSLFDEPETVADEGWFARVIGQSGVSQAWVEIVSYVALIVVAVLAVVVVVNELRVGGVFTRRWRRRGGVLTDASVGIGRRDGGLGWGDLQGVAPARRPGVLLELVVGRLVEVGRLRGARGLTVGELTRVVQLGDEADRGRLAELARTAERVRFSGVEVSGADIAVAVEGGRVLLEGIERAAGAERDGGAGVGL